MKRNFSTLTLVLLIIFAINNSFTAKKVLVAQKAIQTVQNYFLDHEPGTIPFDFPTVETTAQAGEYVLTPSNAFIEKAWADNKTTFIFYSATCVEPGNVESKIKQISGEYTIPNSLIIPIPAGQKAKKGDIVLTWWQSGSGMQRAIVVDDSNPKQPKVKYLDISYDNPAKNKDGVPIGQMVEELKENTFFVITEEWMPGTSVAYKTSYSSEKWTIIKVADDKVLAKGWAGKMAVLEKSKCTAVPVSLKLKKGDDVFVDMYGSFKPGKVSKLDKEAGRVWVEVEFAGSAKEIVVSMGDIINEL